MADKNVSKGGEDLATPEVAAIEVAPEATEVPLGFDYEESGDMIIPRVKVCQVLTPEVREGTAAEGDIINSLTLDKLNGKKFIPVFKFNNNIWWRPRSEGGGILCIARDGKHGQESDGKQLVCATCRKCEFDNTKQGQDSLPKCTKYINFFGFFEGERLPIILSFSKTNYAEGKKLFSLAKVTLQNMWNHAYVIEAKKQAKANNEWFNADVAPAGPTSEADRVFGMQMYTMYRSSLNTINYDMDEAASPTAAADADAATSEY